MDPNTGAILAMASYPDYNPNDAFTIVDTAVADIGLNIDYVIIDELPAKKLVAGKDTCCTFPVYCYTEKLKREKY